MRQRKAFTLVELLVVIGIIALLISILLPALNSARRAAAAVKCESSLREIGNATLMYVQDNKGYTPPAKLSGPYNLYGYPYSNVNNQFAFWFNFLSKYVTKTKVGNSAAVGTATAAQDAANARNNVFWGCPAWNGYAFSSGTNPGDLSAVQTGYSWNAFPEFTPSYPPTGTNLSDAPYAPQHLSVITLTTTPPTGTWYKIGQFTHPTERVLASDGLFWLLQTEKPLDAQGTLYGCRLLSNSGAVTTTGATTADWYRHGKYGGKTPDNLYFNATTGKPSYNILYADGHVRTTNDRADIWRAQRQRYPEP